MTYETSTIYVGVTMETITCCECHMPFAAPDYAVKKLRETGKSFYCPNDHSPGYAQWWVMLNLGNARAPDGKGNAIIVQRFANHLDAEQSKHDIIYGHAVIEQKATTD